MENEVDKDKTKAIWVSKPTLIPLKGKGEKLF